VDGRTHRRRVAVHLVSEIWGTLWDPVQRGRDEVLAVFLLKSAWFTLREAALGFAVGAIVGGLLAVVMLRWPMAEKGLVPWIKTPPTSS